MAKMVPLQGDALGFGSLSWPENVTRLMRKGRLGARLGGKCLHQGFLDGGFSASWKRPKVASGGSVWSSSFANQAKNGCCIAARFCSNESAFKPFAFNIFIKDGLFAASSRWRNFSSISLVRGSFEKMLPSDEDDWRFEGREGFSMVQDSSNRMYKSIARMRKKSSKTESSLRAALDHAVVTRRGVFFRI
jgi:hypothetical protein